MCGCNSSPRLEEASETSYPVSRRKGDFRWRRLLWLTYPVVPASTAQLCLMTRGEIRERKLRVAQRLRAVDQEIKQNVGKKSSKKPPQTLTSATVKGELEPSKRPPTGGWLVRVSDCPHVIESRVSGECSPGMDDVSVMRSSLESNDGTRRHTDEEGSGCDTAPLDASMSRLRKSDTRSTTSDKKEMFFGCNRFLQCRRVVRAPPTTESLASLSVPSCSAAHPAKSQATQTDVESVSFSMWDVPADPQQEIDFLLEQLQSLSSSGITGQKAIRATLQLYPDQQKKVIVAHQIRKLQGTFVEM